MMRGMKSGTAGEFRGPVSGPMAGDMQHGDASFAVSELARDGTVAMMRSASANMGRMRHGTHASFGPTSGPNAPSPGR
jgi:hypothetical protein